MLYAINTEFYCNCYYYHTCIQNFVFYACYRVCVMSRALLPVAMDHQSGAVVMATVTGLDGRSKRREKDVFSNENILVWTRPQTAQQFM